MDLYRFCNQAQAAQAFLSPATDYIPQLSLRLSAKLMFYRLSFIILFLFHLLPITYGQYASTYSAPIPLFYKSPYFNGWINANYNLSSTPAGRWPNFFRENFAS